MRQAISKTKFYKNKKNITFLKKVQNYQNFKKLKKLQIFKIKKIKHFNQQIFNKKLRSPGFLSRVGPRSILVGSFNFKIIILFLFIFISII